MKKYIFLTLLVFIFPFLALAGSEVHITKDGVANVTGVKVMQQAGTTFYTRLIWGDSFVRMLVKTNMSTKFYRATGEATTINEVRDGDYLDIIGELESGTSGLTLVATSIKNSSVQKEQASFPGKVLSINLQARSFVMDTKSVGQVTIQATTTTVFQKGSRTLDLEHLKVGDTIVKASGDYDLSTKVMIATYVRTFVDPNMYKPKTFEGKLSAIISSTTPAVIKINISGIDYIVNLNPNAQILNKVRSSITMVRFVSGDNIRVYGALREVDEPIIDADIIRNTSL